MTTSTPSVHLVHQRCACGRLLGEHMERTRGGKREQTGGTDDGHCSGYTPTWDVYSVRAYVDVPVGEAAPQIELQEIREGSVDDLRDGRCIARWPECYDGGYDPRCCRFPKSCSASI